MSFEMIAILDKGSYFKYNLRKMATPNFHFWIHQIPQKHLVILPTCVGLNPTQQIVNANYSLQQHHLLVLKVN